MIEAREQLVSVLDNRTLADASADAACAVPALGATD
jgi:hypothetical protein